MNGIFGDIFDVIVTAPKRTEILATYPVVIAAGEIFLTVEWGQTLRRYVAGGGTLVVCVGQLSGPGADDWGLPRLGRESEATAFTWTDSHTTIPSQLFHFRSISGTADRILATANDDPVAVARPIGKGQLFFVGVPFGLGSDERPVPILPLILQKIAAGLMPVSASGDVEWAANKLDNGGWVLTLLNNKGHIKPQHGVLPTDQAQLVSVSLHASFPVEQSSEWLTGSQVQWTSHPGGSEAAITISASAVRFVELHPR